MEIGLIRKYVRVSIVIWSACNVKSYNLWRKTNVEREVSLSCRYFWSFIFIAFNEDACTPNSPNTSKNNLIALSSILVAYGSISELFSSLGAFENLSAKLLISVQRSNRSNDVTLVQPELFPAKQLCKATCNRLHKVDAVRHSGNEAKSAYYIPTYQRVPEYPCRNFHSQNVYAGAHNFRAIHGTDSSICIAYHSC